MRANNASKQWSRVDHLHQPPPRRSRGHRRCPLRHWRRVGGTDPGRAYAGAPRTRSRDPPALVAWRRAATPKAKARAREMRAPRGPGHAGAPEADQCGRRSGERERERKRERRHRAARAVVRPGRPVRCRLVLSAWMHRRVERERGKERGGGEQRGREEGGGGGRGRRRATHGGASSPRPPPPGKTERETGRLLFCEEEGVAGKIFFYRVNLCLEDFGVRVCWRRRDLGP